MTEEEHRKYVARFAESMIASFRIIPLPNLVDTIQINLNLYKAGKANPLDFAVVLGCVATAFMEKVKNQADLEDKLHTAQPNPGAN